MGRAALFVYLLRHPRESCIAGLAASTAVSVSGGATARSKSPASVGACAPLRFDEEGCADKSKLDRGVKTPPTMTGASHVYRSPHNAGAEICAPREITL